MEIAVSVEVVWSLEYVLISDGEHNIKHNHEDSTSRESTSLSTLPNLRPHHPSQQEPTHPLGLTRHTDHIGRMDHVELGGGIFLCRSQYGQLTVVVSGAYSSTCFFSASFPWYVLRAPGVAQLLRHLHHPLSLTLPLTATAK